MGINNIGAERLANWLSGAALCTAALLVTATADAGHGGVSGRDHSEDRDSSSAERSVRSAPHDTVVVLDRQRFDLAHRQGLDEFLKRVHELRALSKDEQEDTGSPKKAGKKHHSRGDSDEVSASGARDEDAGSKRPGKSKRAGAEMSQPPASEREEMAGDKRHTGLRDRDWSAKKVREGLKALDKIASKIETDKPEADARIEQVQEIAWAVESNFIKQYFWRPRLDLADLVFDGRHTTLNACGRGSAKDPATDLRSYGEADLSRVDPLPSTYWSPPGKIAQENLYTGFGRTERPDFASEICSYDRPHSGYGGHPSFEVTWKGERWKVKFGEECRSGPFGGRIYAALGFPTEPVDYVPAVKVRWDRRIVTDFNSRRVNRMHISILGLPVMDATPNRYYDPFASIESATLKDGARVGRDELRSRLFPARHGRSRPHRPELNPANLDKAFEAKIDYVVLRDASVTRKEKDADTSEIGYWDYNRRGAQGLRELRALGVVDAWLDNWDVRWANNQLRLTKADSGEYRLEHRVADIGALFGNSTGFLRQVHGHWKVGLYQNVLNDYAWVFTHPQRPGWTTVPICNYMPETKVQAFYDMNLDDARWIGRMIAELSEDQIKAGLIGSGYDAATARFLLEKLVSRRDAMVRDFGLAGEFAPLRPNGADHKLSYDPEASGPFVATLSGGRTYTARPGGDFVVVDGRLRARPHPRGLSAAVQEPVSH